VRPWPTERVSHQGGRCPSQPNFVAVQIVSQAEQLKVQGHIFYGMMYGGAYWCLRPSSNSFPGIDEDHLLGNGDLPLVAKDWREFPLVTLAGMALRGEVSL
jgi:hypothetical protein